MGVGAAGDRGTTGRRVIDQSTRPLVLRTGVTGLAWVGSVLVPPDQVIGLLLQTAARVQSKLARTLGT